MRLAFSNIAWAYPDRHTVYTRLQAAGITGLEIAPRLLFPKSDDPFLPSPDELHHARAEISSAELTLVSMQSLLFGVQGADLFGDEVGRAAFQTGLGRAIGLAERLEIPNLVMGSPKQRKRPDGMDIETAMDRAAEIFRPLADAAQIAGTQIAIECNPKEYGTNFLTTPEETLNFVRYADHDAITLNFDIGAVHLTGKFDCIEDLLQAAGPVISHVHVSEPFLTPAPADPESVARVLCKLGGIGYDHAVSIEMLQHEDGLAGLDVALRYLNAARAAAERNQ